jgi:hypothetical protein
MIGTCVPQGVYPGRASAFGMAREYAPWVALAYAIVGREDQAEEIMTRMREVWLTGKHRTGPRLQSRRP